MGFTEACFDDSEDDMLRALLDSKSPFLEGITLERLDRERSVRLNLTPNGHDEPYLPFAQGGFRTKSGKFEFGADKLDYTPPAESRHGDAELVQSFPLELISGKNDDSMNSTFGYRDPVDRQTGLVSIHPNDASARGITSGMPVRVFNQRGSCFFQAEINDDVPPGVLRARSLRWAKHSPGGFALNQLTSDRLTDIGGGATFYSCLVDVSPAPNTSLTFLQPA
jgi:anaerobic selenocysteine-containing dehydrogenase